ncbi:unnamed protein product [Nesidiocoris tenuis]|uniref:Lipase domain-containing protein n=1 Tax=Nesidiocoris tenuis TaxID=355587 RepID=A0A6H5H686_9HEMI|nr:unnamed protein product [Nesidiocoris tenuis]
MEVLCVIYAPLVFFCSNRFCNLNFSGVPYTIQIIPKGDCSYCCPLDPKNDVTLHLSTRINGNKESLMYEMMGDDFFIGNNKTIVLYIHGFTEQATGPAPQTIKRAYMGRGEENLILVDWSTLSALPWYNHAIENTYFVATTISNFIDELVSKGVTLDRFHIVGFSLGAEIAGLVGKMQSGRLGRITGLDPAMPMYEWAGRLARLDKNDALFVDVIHTDGGVLGFDTPMGHADFYPNGGTPAQPGCDVEKIVEERRINDYVACSHNKAWKYYADSVVNPYEFMAVECKNVRDFERGVCKSNRETPAFMGYAADNHLRGNFFLTTNDRAPYGRGIDGIIAGEKLQSTT